MQFYFYNKVMIKGYFYLALTFILSLMFSCSQEVKFAVDIELCILFRKKIILLIFSTF